MRILAFSVKQQNSINIDSYCKNMRLGWRRFKITIFGAIFNCFIVEMHRTFNLENMETYFHNYVPCHQHRREPITNFCTERICLKFMCPECVQNHSQTHANHPIESIKTCIKKTSLRLKKAISQLQHESSQNDFLKFKSAEEYENQLIRELEEVRKSIIEDINTYFREKQMEVKRQTFKTHHIKDKIKSLWEELNKAISELKLLDNNLFVNQECVNAIKKANKIDYNGLTTHFRKSVLQVKQEMDLNLKIEMNTAKRDELRRVLNNLIGIKGKSKSAQKVGNLGSRVLNERQKTIPQNQYYSDKVEFFVNPPPLSADRLMNQAAFRVDTPNYFQGEPFLHFFEATKSNIHILRIKNLDENKDPKWEVIPLNIKFLIPSFHRTVATENGNIYLIGGTNIQTLQKSPVIYQFDPLHATLNEVGLLSVARSSHSVVCNKRIIYIAGGVSENDEIPKKCELFNSRKNQSKLIAPCKYPTTNSTLCSLAGQNLIKLGGVDMEGRNSDFIQIYNIAADFWGEIDPTIENVKGQFGLLSCSGWAPLNNEQIFIFGGYNEEADNQNSKMSFIFEYNKEEREFYIKYVNMKNLPMAEGFWNPQSIVYEGVIYALQNVDGEDENDCLEDKRNLLVFNGKYWTNFSANQK